MFHKSHTVASMFGAPLHAIPVGTRQPDRLYTSYQEILLGADGSVAFKRNAPHEDGFNNSIPWPTARPVGVTKAW